MKRKFWILYSLILVICTVTGFLIGAFPETWQKLRGRSQDKILLLTSDSRLIPKQFIQDFEKATGKTVQVKSIESYHLFRTEAQNVDLLFAPLAWLGSFPDILSEPPELPRMMNLLSSDFASLRLDLRYFFPLLWQTVDSGASSQDRKTHLQIWGFATPLDSAGSPQDLIFFLSENKSRLVEWAKVTDLKFTLKSTDQIADFPEAQKASHLRDIPLPRLVIDQKLEAVTTPGL